jgi:hypothetical protein
MIVVVGYGVHLAMFTTGGLYSSGESNLLACSACDFVGHPMSAIPIICMIIKLQILGSLGSVCVQ